MLVAQFQQVGRDLFSRGLVSSHNGNLSIRLGDRLFITRRGCMLSGLREQDIIETGIDRNDRGTSLAAPELAIHRAIYQKTPAQAIVQAYPPHAIALSLTEREVAPCDEEGLNLLTKVPVVSWSDKLNHKEIVELTAAALQQCRLVLVSGVGSFAWGQLLEEAYQYTVSLEGSCRILCLLKSIGVKTG